MSELIPLEIPVTLQTVRLIKSYAALSGDDVENITRVLGEEISTLLDSKLKSMIAKEVGAVTHVEAHSMQAAPTVRMYIPKEEAISTDLGDEDSYGLEPEDTPPAEHQNFSRGLTMEDIDRDMEIDDPEIEAKAEPSDLVTPFDNSDDILAEAIGYVDNRIAKRKKRFGKGKGKVTPLSESVLASGMGEGATV
jgi:hypothetical protein